MSVTQQIISLQIVPYKRVVGLQTFLHLHGLFCKDPCKSTRYVYTCPNSIDPHWRCIDLVFLSYRVRIKNILTAMKKKKKLLPALTFVLICFLHLSSLLPTKMAAVGVAVMIKVIVVFFPYVIGDL